MSGRGKRILVVLGILFLLPYVLTVFLGGKEVFNNKENCVKVMQEGNVEIMPWGEFLLGIVAKEIPKDYSQEAIKAQMVIAGTRLHLEAQDAEVTHVYEETFYDIEDMKQKWGEKEAIVMYECLEAALKEVQHQVLFFDGEIAITPYHMLNNGDTRNGKMVLGEPYSYLQSCTCPLDKVAEKETTMTTIKYEELGDILSKGLGIDLKGLKSEDIKITEKDEVDYVLKILLKDELVDGESFRNALGLKSSCFHIEKNENNCVITTKGVGHGIGLSQNTAHHMGLEGKSYKEILQYFYPKTEILEWKNK